MPSLSIEPAQLSGFTYLLGRPTLADLEIDVGLDHIKGEPSTPDTYLPRNPGANWPTG